MQKTGLDISPIIRSKDVREYYSRNQIELTVEEQEAIIVNSYLPLSEKVEWLKRLRDVCAGDEKKNVSEMLSYVEFTWELYKNPEKHYPDDRIFYILEKWYYESDIRGTADAHNFMNTYIQESECFDSIEEMEDYMNSYVEPEYKKYVGKSEEHDELFQVNLIVLPQNGRHIELVEYIASQIDGKYVPFYFFANREVDERKEWADAVERFEDMRTFMRPEMPFEHGSRVKIQLPGMKEPFFGTMSSELDGNGCRYRFLYGDREDLENYGKNSDFSYLAMKELYFSVLDWIERAD